MGWKEGLLEIMQEITVYQVKKNYVQRLEYHKDNIMHKILLDYVPHNSD